MRNFGESVDTPGILWDLLTPVEQSSGNMLKSLGILENIRAICGANLGNRQGGVDHDWKFIGNVSDALDTHTGGRLPLLDNSSP